MDTDPQVESEFDRETILEEHDPPPDQYTGAFFPGATNFVVKGGKFKSVTNIHQAVPSVPPAFRVIPLGDLNLLHSVGPGRGSQVGDGAEEQWRQEISRYSELRHPDLLQLYGIIANNSGIRLDLMSYAELEKRYRNSHFSTIFLWACMHWSEYNVWIRPSTGRLCIDLSSKEADSPVLAIDMGDDFRPSVTSLLNPPEDNVTMASMSLQHYHDICGYDLSRGSVFSISSHPVSVKLGSIRYFRDLEYESSFEIGVSPDCMVIDRGWLTEDLIVEDRWVPIKCDQEGISIMENGWIRFNSDEVADEYCRRVFTSNFSPSWLAQANHIFNRLGISSNFEDYVIVPAAVVEGVRYHLSFSGARDILPLGYLFLCPVGNLQCDDSPTCFQSPSCLAYWSFDPSGVDRISDELVRELGFPAIEFQMRVYGLSWNESVYAGIHQFHEAKGYDPYGQEVALALGCPVFQITRGRDALSAHNSDGSVHEEPVPVDYADMNAPPHSASAQIHLYEQNGLACLDELCEISASNVEKSFEFPGLNEEMFSPSWSWKLMIHGYPTKRLGVLLSRSGYDMQAGPDSFPRNRHHNGATWLRTMIIGVILRTLVVVPVHGAVDVAGKGTKRVVTVKKNDVLPPG
ncbi:hypothetical protein C8J57DRAFT_1223079 [Mycena rebaudengoi]|nr:hypothetical protein C8J57DRAFT_1223079 [Mycena rebaudengoi]